MLSSKRVLIADDDNDLIRALALRCRAHGVAVDAAPNGVTAIVKARKDPPDLLILDIGMPEADGFKVCDRLQELDSRIPVIVMTGRTDDETCRRCEALGAHYVPKGGDMWEKLAPLMLSLLRTDARDNTAATHEPEQQDEEVNVKLAPTVLLVDDDPAITKALKIRLQQHGLATIEASNGLEAYDCVLRHLPDVIITDYTMPAGSGDHLLIRLNRLERTKSIPVIVLTGQTFNGDTDVALRRDLLGRRGASAYLAKPVDFAELIGELARHVPLSLAGPAAAAGSGYAC